MTDIIVSGSRAGGGVGGPTVTNPGVAQVRNPLRITNPGNRGQARALRNTNAAEARRAVPPPTGRRRRT